MAERSCAQGGGVDGDLVASIDVETFTETSGLDPAHSESATRGRPSATSRRQRSRMLPREQNEYRSVGKGSKRLERNQYLRPAGRGHEWTRRFPARTPDLCALSFTLNRRKARRRTTSCTTGIDCETAVIPHMNDDHRRLYAAVCVIPPRSTGGATHPCRNSRACCPVLQAQTCPLPQLLATFSPPATGYLGAPSHPLARMAVTGV